VTFPSYTAPFDLPQDDRERLETLIQSDDYPRLVTTRFVIVLLSGNGLTVSEIAKRLGITLTPVYRWRKAYLRDGVPGLLKTRRPRLRAVLMPPPCYDASFPLPKRDQDQLEELVQSDNFSRRFVIRFFIVLLCGDGVKAKAIANRLGIAVPTVYRWRAVYLRYGVPGLLKSQRLTNP